MYKSEINISNDSSKPIKVWIEPWAFDLGIPAGLKAKFYADSEFEGELEKVDAENEVEIWGWCGSNLKIYIDDKLEWDTEELRVPGLPAGVTTKDFVSMAFNDNPLTAKPKFKKWWQFWK